MIPDFLQGRLVCTVPEAGRACGISRDSAYRAAAAGQIPTLRVGRRLLVPVPKLLELLGIATAPPPDMATAGVPAPAAALTHDSRQEIPLHERRAPESDSLRHLRPA